MAKTIIGYRKWRSEKGSFCIINVTSPYTEREKNFGAVGTGMKEEWIPVEFQDLFQPSCIGKSVVLTYEPGANNRAYIVGVKII